MVIIKDKPPSFTGSNPVLTAIFYTLLKQNIMKKKTLLDLWIAFVAGFTFVWSLSIPDNYEIGHVIILLISLLTLTISIAYRQFMN